MYEQRATMGGYFDEVYEAKFRIGSMKARLGRPWPEIQQAAADYCVDPMFVAAIRHAENGAAGRELLAVRSR